MDLTGFLAFSESSNFFMVVGARILLLSSASLQGKENGLSVYPMLKEYKNPGKGPSYQKDMTGLGSKAGRILNTQFAILELLSGRELIKS